MFVVLIVLVFGRISRGFICVNKALFNISDYGLTWRSDLVTSSRLEGSDCANSSMTTGDITDCPLPSVKEPQVYGECASLLLLVSDQEVELFNRDESVNYLCSMIGWLLGVQDVGGA